MGYKVDYMNQFLMLKSAPELLPFFHGGRKPSKEITEAFAMFNAYNKYFHQKYRNEQLQVVCVGDGKWPRCGSIFAYLTKHFVLSVDPIADLQFATLKTTERLTVMAAKVEDLKINCGKRNTILLFPHSHADMDKALDSVENYNDLHCIAMPCCVDVTAKWKLRPHISYNDNRVWSPKNEIWVWEFVK